MKKGDTNHFDGQVFGGRRIGDIFTHTVYCD